jgi:nucleotide-binding universal stress UspA family protein
MATSLLLIMDSKHLAATLKDLELTKKTLSHLTGKWSNEILIMQIKQYSLTLIVIGSGKSGLKERSHGSTTSLVSHTNSEVSCWSEI